MKKLIIHLNDKEYFNLLDLLKKDDNIDYILILTSSLDTKTKTLSLNPPFSKIVFYLLLNKVIDNVYAIGSDEVGTGDTFGGFVVSACLINEEILNKIKNIDIKDSKAYTSYPLLLDVYDNIKDVVKSITYILKPNEYNNLIDKYHNINILKAKLHNKLLYILKKENPEVPVIIDKFCSEELYYKYLSSDKEVVDDVFFINRAESINKSVASASIIARYHFISHINELSNTYGIKIPLGSVHNINETLKEIYNKYNDKEIYRKLCKVDFKNVKSFLANLDNH
jgi:ribonuclease HIII